MGNSNNFSSKEVYSPIGIYISSIVTSVIIASMWFITNNLVILIASVLIIPFLVFRFAHRNATRNGKILFAIILILLFVICSVFFRVKPNDKVEEDVESPGIVIEEDTVPSEDVATPEEAEDNLNEEDITNQKVTKGKSNNKKKGNVTPKPNEVITPTYSGVGGNPSGPNVNRRKCVINKW